MDEQPQEGASTADAEQRSSARQKEAGSGASTSVEEQRRSARQEEAGNGASTPADPSTGSEQRRSARQTYPLSALLAAVQFLLISPAFIRRTFTDREMGESVGYYPLVGLLLGLILALLDGLLGLIFPLAVRTVLVLAAWVVLTGALHLDGFLDASDGLLGGFTPEKRLEIMRDERRGAYALAGGILLLLLQYSALISLPPVLSNWRLMASLPLPMNVPGAGRTAALLLAPVLGRWGMSLAVTLFPYARPAGLGRTIKDNAGISQARLATIIMLFAVILVYWLDYSLAGIIAVVVALAVWIAVIRFTLKRIPGLTGDLYGTICILMETGVLLTYAAAFTLLYSATSLL